MKPKPPLKDVPEWAIRLARHVQRFPGDGYSHALTMQPLFLTPLYAVEPPDDFTKVNPNRHEVVCPCGQHLIVSPGVVRAHGESDVIECPQCRSWHSILWHQAKDNSKGGKFIIAGTK